MIPRIYHPHPLALDQTVTLTDRASHKCLHVLRLKANQTIQLFCGDGAIYDATLSLEKKQVLAHTTDKTEVNNESPLVLHLAQGLARNDRMDFIIQKAVECGVHSITPLMTEKSKVRIQADRLENKRHHWEQVLINACEQSGRCYLPQLNPPIALHDWLEQTCETIIGFQPDAKYSLKSLPKLSAPLHLLLGPESGFSPRELKQIEEKATLCQLGPRILRTETATLASLVALQTLFGDMA